jgi:hypothetical protein
VCLARQNQDGIIRNAREFVQGSSISAQARRSAFSLNEELGHIPSSYGRLVYLAGLLDPNTGRYNHYGLALESSERELNVLIRRAHESVFQDWVNLPLELKMADVELYIASLPDVDQVELVDAWLRLTPYKNLVPASIQGPERQKHISDFEAILGLLKNVYGVSAPDLDA